MTIVELAPRHEEVITELAEPEPAKYYQRILERAADILDQYGWGIKHYHVYGRNYCAVGAISSAWNELYCDIPRGQRARVRREAEQAVLGRISPAPTHRDPRTAIIMWNDA